MNNARTQITKCTTQ